MKNPAHKRKVVQIATYPDGTLVALCDDGTIWELDSHKGWKQVATDAVTMEKKR